MDRTSLAGWVERHVMMSSWHPSLHRANPPPAPPILSDVAAVFTSGLPSGGGRFRQLLDRLHHPAWCSRPRCHCCSVLDLSGPPTPLVSKSKYNGGMSASLPPALADPQSATGRPAADEELASQGTVRDSGSTAAAVPEQIASRRSAPPWPHSMACLTPPARGPRTKVRAVCRGCTRCADGPADRS